MTSSRRFELLDAFRGLAAIAVVGFHSVNTLVPRGAHPISDLLWLGWIGVYVFFPISGYCVLAASHATGATPRQFLIRRWTRIFPTYWASILVVIAVTVALAPFSHGSPAVLWEIGWGWISVLSLTQTFVGLEGAVNPVYWSLCYEEQFYLVVAATLLAPARARRWVLLALTMAVAGLAASGLMGTMPAGLFVDRWMCFAPGLAVFGWYDERYGRSWAASMLALSAVGIVASGPLEVSTALASSVAFILLRPLDGRAAEWRPVRWLGGVGAFSYSLYLTHVPIAGRFVNLARRSSGAVAAWPLVVLIAMAAALLFGLLFFAVVERRFLRRSPAPAAAPHLDLALAGAES